MSNTHQDPASAPKVRAGTFVRWIGIGAAVLVFAVVLAWALHLGRPGTSETEIDTHDLGATTAPAPAPEATPPPPPPHH
jgi:hypothetical protein